MPTAGWYEDPQQAGGLRWWDGDAWTEHVTGGARSRAASAAESAAPEPADGTYPTQAIPTVTGNDEHAVYEHGGQAEAGYPPSAYQPTGFHPTAYPPDSGHGTGYEAAGYPASYPAGYEAAGYPAAYPAGPTYGVTPSTVPPPRQSRTLPIILLVCLVLVAGLLTGAYFLFLRGSPSYTFNGKAISKPAGVLTSAQDNLNALVARRHAATGSDTRCYFAKPTRPAPGAKKTDIAADAYCGPVLFVDGTPGADYLRFPLTNSASSGSAKLAVSPQPSSDTPGAKPADLALSRPDGKTAPSSDSVKAPAPPPADKDAFLAAPLGNTTLKSAPDSAV
ncbi:MAG: DUF2510 domain-containing protein, partial [Actinobacteria bacterium]|nr:DUF2510 domain-containing protein [Actinomycetota bacterium]